MDLFIILFIVLLVYIVTLFLLRSLSIGAKKECSNCKNCCPDCSSSLGRIKRIQRDHLLYHITFRLFSFKRYKCANCGWEGLRWEKPYKGLN